MKRKLLVIETHPIQYKAPLFRLLAQRDDLDFEVLYAMMPDTTQQGAGFGVAFAWDVPLLEGYHYAVLENRARQPSVTTFEGCDTPAIYHWLRRDRPDVVLVNGWVTKTCVQALWACRRLGIPCMVRGEANLLRPRARWKHVGHRLLLMQYDAYLYIGSANREFYRLHRCPDDRLFFAPYAVDNAYFAACAYARTGQRGELRDQLGIPRDALVFLFAGKLEAKKHPNAIIQAVTKMPATARSRAHVLMAGEGPLRSTCEASARNASLPVTFAGFLNQSRMPDAYAAADVLVLPSDAGETWGLVVNEAMASGRPAIVSTSAGCCADLIVEGVTGYAFAVHDSDQLAARMAAYARQPSLAHDQGRAAAHHIQDFCPQRIADSIVDAVTCVTAKSQKARRR